MRLPNLKVERWVGCFGAQSALQTGVRLHCWGGTRPKSVWESFEGIWDANTKGAETLAFAREGHFKGHGAVNEFVEEVAPLGGAMAAVYVHLGDGIRCFWRVSFVGLKWLCSTSKSSMHIMFEVARPIVMPCCGNTSYSMIPCCLVRSFKLFWKMDFMICKQYDLYKKIQL